MKNLDLLIFKLRSKEGHLRFWKVRVRSESGELDKLEDFQEVV